MVSAFDPSNPNETAVAGALYAAITSPDARAVLDWMIDHPDERVTSAELAERLEFGEHKQVGLAMYELGLAANELDRARPWGEGQPGYLMPIDQAALFRSAREQAWREENARG